jgi:protein tyrosine/serine phosphatase
VIRARWLLPILLGAGAVAAGARAQAPGSLVRVELPGVPNFAAVSPGLWRGAQPTEDGFRQLQVRGVRTIVNLRASHDDEKKMAGLGLRYYRLRSRQWNPETEDVVRAMKIILSPEYQPVFVHCQAGKDRTGLVVAVYRVLVDGWTVDDAIAERKAYGANGIWEENEGYLRRLRHPAAQRRLRALIELAPMPHVTRVP